MKNVDLEELYNIDCRSLTGFLNELKAGRAIARPEWPKANIVWIIRINT